MMQSSQRNSAIAALAAGLVALATLSNAAAPASTPARQVPLTLVVTQLPIGTPAEKAGPRSNGMLSADYGDGARLVLVTAGKIAKVLTPGFASAADPDVSFDGKRILFAAKKDARDRWAIYEMNADGSGVRPVFAADDDLRQPIYLPTVYTLVADPNKGTEPRDQIGFVRVLRGQRNEHGDAPLSALYSVKLDGTQPRRLTYSLSSHMDPTVLRDGRVVYASWQRATLDHGEAGRIALVGVNPDGLDAAVFAADEGKRIKTMPAATPTADRLVVFVEAEKVGWDGAGSLASVSLRRNLHSYRRLTDDAAGLFHAPAALPDGTIVAARRPADGSGTHAIVRVDTTTGRITTLFDDPGFHDMQPRPIAPRLVPDRRSSAVKDPDEGRGDRPAAPTQNAQPGPAILDGKLYGLNVYLNDLGRDLEPGTIAKLRVIEGLPGQSRGDQPVAPTRRLVGEAPVERDGSYHVVVPAEVPLQLQILDADGLALRSSGWVWVPYKGQQGCVGCHEDGEMTPSNRFVDAIARPANRLDSPPEQRRTIDFRHDILPLVKARCVSCHGKASGVRLDDGLVATDASGAHARAYETLLAGHYVHPGRARTSPLVWHLFGRNKARPWDGTAATLPAKLIAEHTEISDDERALFVEWIDLGALWDKVGGIGQ